VDAPDLDAEEVATDVESFIAAAERLIDAKDGQNG
jgi:hypothetical protein